MSQFIKSKEFMLGLIIVVQLFIYVPYFFETPDFVQSVESNLLTTSVVIATFALLVGVYTTTRRELVRISKKVKGWQLSVWLLFVTWFMVLVGVFLGQNSPLFTFFSDAILVPGDATIYSLILFYMISAGARAFRARDTESTLLIIVAVLVLLQQAPVAGYIWPGFEVIGAWFVDNLGMAITRVFSIIVALGGIVLAVRLITGHELGVVGILKGEKE